MMQTNNHGIDTYNGIMLCKRPDYNNKHISTTTIKSSHSNQKTESTQKNPMITMTKKKTKTSNPNNEQGSFLCGTVPTPWGATTRNHQNTKQCSEKIKVLSRLSKNDDALNRHKQWLKEMQKKRELKIKQSEEEERLKKEKSIEFMERQAKRRQRIRQLEAMMGGEENVENIQEDTKNDRKHENSNKNNNDTCLNSKSGEKRSRPAWSLTEIEANNFQHNIQQEEEKDLIDFVDNLVVDIKDFEQYVDDMELKILMNQVKHRIQQLEKEKKNDESLLDVVVKSEKSSVHNEKFNMDDDHNDFICQRGDDDGNDMQYNRGDDDEIQSIAATVRSRGDTSISSIHSRKSMHMLVSKSKDRLESSSRSNKTATKQHTTPLEIIDEGNVCNGREMRKITPKTVVHVEDDGARLAETKSLNKLPFKNRNPAL